MSDAVPDRTRWGRKHWLGRVPAVPVTVPGARDPERLWIRELARMLCELGVELLRAGKRTASVESDLGEIAACYGMLARSFVVPGSSATAERSMATYWRAMLSQPWQSIRASGSRNRTWTMLRSAGGRSARRDRGRLQQLMARAVLRILQAPSEQGALPRLHAATALDVRGGEFFRPSGYKEMRGRDVREVQPGVAAAHPETGHRLWTQAEQLTGVTYL
ncbi:hypothetical protein [Streptomyces sp. NBC_01264]|uniref:hypothetical protein n=1 Tax=Streptomyces sp. NBC_01264 TaxID=2903804 RepID=UPI0022562014|nr:hypothetical protein [Streptomyces sp. NBC_01264]MCX4781533.1 hypothetical protein [Streptomyces sp. NBC_01264]